MPSDHAIPVKRYLMALRDRDFAELRACLAPDVVRLGPYRDVYEGREEYASFLEEMMPKLSGYQLDVHRVLATPTGAFVELSETVDDRGAALRTEEGIVFDVEDGLITRIAVYLQTSERVDRR